MRRNMNVLIPVAVASAVLIGGVAVVAYQHGHHDTSGTLGANTTNPPSTIVYERPDAHCHMHGELPDPVCTPGTINVTVTQANIQITICKSGFSKSVRP